MARNLLVLLFLDREMAAALLAAVLEVAVVVQQALVSLPQAQSVVTAVLELHQQ
jgi:hypothetical protein